LSLRLLGALFRILQLGDVHNELHRFSACGVTPDSNNGATVRTINFHRRARITKFLHTFFVPIGFPLKSVGIGIFCARIADNPFE